MRLLPHVEVIGQQRKTMAVDAEESKAKEVIIGSWITNVHILFVLFKGGAVFKSSKIEGKARAPVAIARKPVTHAKASQPMDMNKSVVLTKKQVISHKPVSIFDRLGTSSAAPSGISGTKVTIKNLNRNITSSDIAELCSSVGEVKQVDVMPDATGTLVNRLEIT